MKRIGLAMAVLMLVGAAAQEASNPSVEGLWAGIDRNGPDVRGTLLIVERGAALTAC